MNQNEYFMYHPDKITRLIYADYLESQGDLFLASVLREEDHVPITYDFKGDASGWGYESGRGMGMGSGEGRGFGYGWGFGKGEGNGRGSGSGYAGNGLCKDGDGDGRGSLKFFHFA
jgi:hypothetical protein